MRSKADAIKDPSGQDRWRTIGHRWHGAGECRSVNWNDGAEVGYILRRLGRTRLTSDPIDDFRRWCAGAEYLGGAE